MSLQLQSGETGCNQQKQAVTGQGASVVGLGSAFFLCQTVFWHRPYPNILPKEHGHSLALTKGIALRGKVLSHAFPIPQHLTAPVTPAFSGVTRYVVSWQQANMFK